MTNIKVRKSPGPALAAALIAACGVMIISFFIMGLLAPFENPNITPAYFWKTVWNDGFLRYCGTGLQAFNLDCRTARSGDLGRYSGLRDGRRCARPLP